MMVMSVCEGMCVLGVSLPGLVRFLGHGTCKAKTREVKGELSERVQVSWPPELGISLPGGV